MSASILEGGTCKANLLTALAALLVATAAHDARAEGSSQRASTDTAARYELKIQPQPLGAALQEFAKQSGIQIIFFSKLTDGHDAPALSGKYTYETALNALLQGTG